MRGTTLFILGVLLTLSNASGTAGTASSIAQTHEPARVPALAQAKGTVSLLPLENAEGHEARRPQRLVARQTSWRPIAVSVKNVLPVQPVVTPRAILPAVDQPDIQEHHKIIASEVLRLLPEQCQRQIQNFYVRYDKPERRGLAGKSTIIMDGTLSDDEFRAVLIHEAMGHVFDLGCLNGGAAAGRSPFLDGSDPVFNDDPSLAFYRISWMDARTKKATTQPEDFASGYAQTDPFEDFAETAITYLLQHRTLVERAKTNRALATKLKWFETFLPVTPVAQPVPIAAWDGVIPWDATKLKYTWNNPTVVAKQ